MLYIFLHKFIKSYYNGITNIKADHFRQIRYQLYRFINVPKLYRRRFFPHLFLYRTLFCGLFSDMKTIRKICFPIIVTRPPLSSRLCDESTIFIWRFFYTYGYINGREKFLLFFAIFLRVIYRV